MAKLSAEQIRQLKELEALRDAEDDDEELSVWVRKGDHETRLTGDRARRWLQTNGYDADDAEDATKAEPLPEKTTKTPTKKATPAKATPTETDTAELEQDAPQPQPRRAFF